MSTRSLNKVMLIGNLTRDPVQRFTGNNTMVATFGIATNRDWTNDAGEKQEQVEYHNIVAWTKLAEICVQLLHKGDKVYVDGRMQTRDWQGEDGQSRRQTEVVIENMILLRSSNPRAMGDYEETAGEETTPTKKSNKKKTVVTGDLPEAPAEDVSDDIPF